MKTKFLLAAAAILILASCTKEQGGTSTPKVPGFDEISFLAEKNEHFLVSNVVVPSPSAGRVEVVFPIDVDESEFAAMSMTFKLNDANAKVIAKVEEEVTETEGEGEDAKEVTRTKIVDLELASGDTLDFSNPIDIYVSKDNKTSIYTIVCKVTAVAQDWILFASTDISEESSQAFSTDPFFTIAPNGTIYLAGKNLDDTKKVVVLKSNDAGGFDFAVEQKTLSESAADFISMTVSSNNVPYIAFLEASSKVSVMKIENNVASYIGEAQSILKVQNNPVAIYVNAQNHLWCAGQTARNASTTLGRYMLNLAFYDGTSWTNENAISGRASNAYAYFPTFKNNYLFVCNFNQSSFSCYDLSGDTPKSVLEDVKIYQADGETEVSYTQRVAQNSANKSFEIDKDGNIYISLAAKFDGENDRIGVVKFDKEKNQSILGGVFPYPVSGQYLPSSIALDKDGIMFLTYLNDNGKICISHIDNTTKQWTAPIVISGTDYRSSGNLPEIKMLSSNGKLYIMTTKANKQTDIYVSE